MTGPGKAASQTPKSHGKTLPKKEQTRKQQPPVCTWRAFRPKKLGCPVSCFSCTVTHCAASCNFQLPCCPPGSLPSANCAASMVLCSWEEASGNCPGLGCHGRPKTALLPVGNDTESLSTRSRRPMRPLPINCHCLGHATSSTATGRKDASNQLPNKGSLFIQIGRQEPPTGRSLIWSPTSHLPAQ